MRNNIVLSVVVLALVFYIPFVIIVLVIDCRNDDEDDRAVAWAHKDVSTCSDVIRICVHGVFGTCVLARRMTSCFRRTTLVTCATRTRDRDVRGDHTATRRRWRERGLTQAQPVCYSTISAGITCCAVEDVLICLLLVIRNLLDIPCV